MGWFSLGRAEGFPSQYEDNLTPVTVDVLDAGFICAFLILLISFCFSLPTTNVEKSVSAYIRVTISLLIGLFLLLGNFGQEWEVGEIESKTAYRAGTGAEINATIGIKIGLRSVNVTLKRIASQHSSQPLENETINYNERFSWTWDQGRFGFGPYAGELQREFRAAQYQGLPLPILWVVDYFVIDGEGFRFGRFYRTAGWYSHIAMWTAFPCWIIANVLFTSVLHYGAYYLGLSGILQLTANLVWIIVRNPLPLEIPFEDGILKTHFGFSFWLTFTTGLICIIIALIIVIMDFLDSRRLYMFFGVDPLNVYEETHLTTEELQCLRTKNASNNVPMVMLTPNMSTQENETKNITRAVLMRRGTMKSAARKIMKKNYNHEDEEPIYGNV